MKPIENEERIGAGRCCLGGPRVKADVRQFEKGLKMRSVAPKVGIFAGSVLAVFLVIATALQPASAQTQPPFATQTQRSPQAPTQPRATAPKKDDESRAESVGDLRKRIDALEQQLLDMQVIYGALESLARQGTNARPSFSTNPSPNSSDTAAWLDGLEVQIRALAAQMDRLEQQLQSPQNRSSLPTAPSERQATNLPPIQQQPKENITDVLRNDPAPKSPVSQQPSQPPRPQRVAVDAGAVRDAYLRAYNLLIKQDYAGAETGFAAFLENFGEHELAGNAQYWLAETYYVRGQFEQAAQAFLKGYQTYGRGQKAPDSLLKLAITLDRLGKREAACATFAQLNQKFPNAPQHLLGRAQAERVRLGCS
ncbi:MAG: tol-pal system protein YbgF [Hyphomicrobiaceae bacterium]|nr:MAG: tol-pal system protein YbgF [Hyphomicrobiaceae bacterium]